MILFMNYYMVVINKGDDISYVMKKLIIEEYNSWGLNVNIKSEYSALEIQLVNLQLPSNIIIKQCKYTND